MEKLVRDNIPQIIENSGKQCDIELMNNNKALEYLYVKLNEETFKLFESKDLEELADIMEIIFSIAKKYGYSEEELLKKKKEKLNLKGGFDKNILLKNIY